MHLYPKGYFIGYKKHNAAQEYFMQNNFAQELYRADNATNQDEQSVKGSAKAEDVAS